MKPASVLPASVLIATMLIWGGALSAEALTEESIHVVIAGETLNGIANRAGVSASAVARANGLRSPYTVREGQKLAIPRKPGNANAASASTATESVHVVARGETLGGIANRAGVPASAIARANDLDAPFSVRTGQRLTIPRASRSELERAPKTAARVIAPKAPASTAQDRAAGGAPRPEQETVHIVAAGETLGGIAARAEVPRVLIAEANGLTPPYALHEGQSLTIPRTRRHTVSQDETGFTISYKYGVPWDQIALANGLSPDAQLRPGQTLLIPTLLSPPRTAGNGTAPPPPSAQVSASSAKGPSAASPRFAWPVNGPVRRQFATGANYHNGLDITAPRDTMVRAAAAGKVRFAGFEKEQYGNLVVLDHGNGWFTAYGFLSRVTVKEGANVAAGERIGLVGDTGQAKGNELHFEIRRDGEPVDPANQLPTAP